MKRYLDLFVSEGRSQQLRLHILHLLALLGFILARFPSLNLVDVEHLVKLFKILTLDKVDCGVEKW